MSPAPSLLSREQIVTATIDLLDAHGADAFSMRRLGAALGVDPMAVYYHVPNKGALFDLVVDAVWTRVAAGLPARDTPDASAPAGDPTTAGAEPAASERGDWQGIVADVARGLRRELLAHPNLVGILATRPLVTPTMMALVEATLGRLAAAGLAPAPAMELIDCAVAYAVGKVQGELRRPVGGADRQPDDVYAALTPDAVPHLAAALAGGYTWAPDAQFERGLAALLAGWQADPAPGRPRRG